MSITLNGTTGITTPDVTSDGSLKINASAPDNSVVVDASGNVGIGSTAPSTNKLHIESAGATRAVVYNSSNAVGVRIQALTGSGLIQTDTNHPLQFATNNGAVQMQIDTAGRVTMPYQPAFVVNIQDGDNGSQADITPSYIALNIGGHYSSSNGRFTAPVAGLYYFQFSVLMKNMGGGDDFEINILKNASTYLLADRKTYSSGSTGTVAYLPGLVHAIVPMNTNDYVTFQYYRTGSTGAIHISDVWSKISGYLIG